MEPLELPWILIISIYLKKKNGLIKNIDNLKIFFYTTKIIYSLFFFFFFFFY